MKLVALWDSKVRMEEARSAVSDEQSAEALVRELYARHAQELRGALGRLSPGRADLDDLLHDVFVVALRRAALLASCSDPRSWLFGVAVKVAQGSRRRARFWRFVGLDSVTERASDASASADADRNDAARVVSLILERLSEKKRAVFVLFELERLTGQQVAAALDIPLKTVWTRLFHARREFLHHLEQLQGRAP